MGWEKTEMLYRHTVHQVYAYEKYDMLEQQHERKKNVNKTNKKEWSSEVRIPFRFNTNPCIHRPNS